MISQAEIKKKIMWVFFSYVHIRRLVNFLTILRKKKWLNILGQDSDSKKFPSSEFDMVSNLLNFQEWALQSLKLPTKQYFPV